jgi:hypothetical protein
MLPTRSSDVTSFTPAALRVSCTARSASACDLTGPRRVTTPSFVVTSIFVPSI